MRKDMQLSAIVFEDFGLASLKITQAVVAAASDRAWRGWVGGDAKVVSCLIDLLVEHPRDRRIDELYMLAVKLSGDPDPYGSIRDLNGSPELSGLVQKAVEIVFQCEQADRYRGRRIVLAKACDAVLGGLLERGGLDKELYATCLKGRRTAKCLLPILLPPWAQAADAGQQKTVERLVPRSPILGGVPIYCVDGYTLPGRVALGRLARVDRALAKIMIGIRSSQERMTCLINLLFVVEGGICTRELSDPLYEELRANSVGCWTGLPRSAVPDALEAMHNALPLLDQLRAQVLGAEL